MDKKTLARAYDRSAEGYDARFASLQRPKYEAGVRMLEALPLVLGPGASVLDAGAGTGLFAAFLREQEALVPTGAAARLRAIVEQGRMCALDVSLAMLRQARVRGLPCVCADVAVPPLRPRGFALVVSFTSLIGDPTPGVRALGPLVAPGGVLLLSLLTKDHPGGARLASQAGAFALAEEVMAGQDRITMLIQRGS